MEAGRGGLMRRKGWGLESDENVMQEVGSRAKGPLTHPSRPHVLFPFHARESVPSLDWLMRHCDAYITECG